MTQDELKQQVGRAAANYVLSNVAHGAVLGVGTGSTVNFFIDEVAAFKDRFRGAVSSSNASTARLRAHGFEVLELNDIETLPVYVDGADEIDAAGHMIKGGGGALTREKIVAMVAQTFVCIVDESKRVDLLGAFPLPVEVIPMASAAIARRFVDLDGQPTLRVAKDGSTFVTDNGNWVLDVHGLRIPDPVGLEAEVNNWPGVVTVGLFARRGANISLLGTKEGVHRIDY
ncbi:ribose-5-phosphate isomerase RpiA [Pararobbsia silviterrae]|uniref:Ribose-5-phosphate isomerase A n=1 Tax=Pararobbsia silviterrae TaxID=1792498 RepID=A0A494XRZ5_9BURK|nr:ribose-5-phosphate isomerase RpiA [Pararobbsia silviterrae]RKP50303.1 ribose-5-phosphate isomerase RpiA [Pararobbsia silviterrae]